MQFVRALFKQYILTEPFWPGVSLYNAQSFAAGLLANGPVPPHKAQSNSVASNSIFYVSSWARLIGRKRSPLTSAVYLSDADQGSFLQVPDAGARSCRHLLPALQGRGC